MKKMLRSKKGFSLVELLIVLTIIAVISALAINVFGNVSEKAKIKADNAQAENIKKAIISYMAETEDVKAVYLDQFTTLEALVTKFNGPIEGQEISDETGNTALVGNSYGPYMNLPVNGDDAVLPNPKQAGGERRWIVNYNPDTQNVTVTITDAAATDNTLSFTGSTTTT